MSDLTYSWKFYTYNMLFGADVIGNLKGDVDQITLDPHIRSNEDQPLGTGVTLTYRFVAGTPDGHYGDFTFKDEEMPHVYKGIAREVFDEYSALTNLKFVEAKAGQAANINIYQINEYMGRGTAVARPDTFDAKIIIGLGDDPWNPGQYSRSFVGDDWRELFRHELGHVMGLSHPANYFGPDADAPFDPASTNIPWAEETRQFSVMSYNDHDQFYRREPETYSYFYEVNGVAGIKTEQSLGIFDIKTLQFLYGANTAPTAGDDTYTFRAQDASQLSIYDSGGTDTFDLSNQLIATKVNLNEASFSSIGKVHTIPGSNISFVNNIAISWDTVIENVKGSERSDTVIGNPADNLIQGNGGNDILSGGAGSDTLEGGSGNDELWAGVDDDSADHMVGDSGNDTLGGAFGDDTLEGGSGQDVLFGGEGVDVLIGADGNDSLFGGMGADIIEGGAENDLIYGGKGDGDDSLTAGDGDDTLYAGQGDDVIEAGSGADLVFSGPGNDNLSGGSGNDTLWGGPDDDRLTGGTGNDIFAFVAGFGVDTIRDFGVGEDNKDILDLSAIDGLTVDKILDSAFSTSTSTMLSFDDIGSIMLVGVGAHEWQNMLDQGQVLGNE